MPIQQRITVRSLPVETYNQFTANFNNPAGQYGFTQVAGNQGQIVINTRPDTYYLIDKLSFSASIPETVFFSSLGAGAIQPEFRLRFLKASNTPAYPFPFPGINYKDNMDFSFWFHSAKQNDQLLIDMTGVINQVPATVGIAQIFAQLSYVIYQENNLNVVRRIAEATCNNVGAFYQNGM